MNFEQFQYLVQKVCSQHKDAREVKPERLPPLVLAYVGDAYFTLYVRTKLLGYEQNQVRVLHTFDSKIVSAAMQSYAVRSMENELSAEEMNIVRRGRNARSTPTKNASVSEYRYSTGLEALIGYLFLSRSETRLNEIVEKVFYIAMRKLNGDETCKGEET